MWRLYDLDLEIFRRIHQGTFGTAIGEALYVLQLAGQWQGMAVLVALAAFLAPRGRRFRVALQVTLGVLLAGGTSEVLKRIVSAPRPPSLLPDDMAPGFRLLHPDTARHSYSFPSGHTTAAFAFAMGVCVLGVRRTGVAAAFLVAVGTGLGRISLGAHFPTDVLAGALLGSVVAWVARRPRDRFGAALETWLGQRFPGWFEAAVAPVETSSPPAPEPSPR